ncbi:MAG: Ig-like domain-containing protein, partial [Gemmatirosa sp.]
MHRAAAIALAALTGAACAGDTSLAPRERPSAQLALSATVVGAQGATLRLRVFYRRAPGAPAPTTVDVARTELPVAGGERALPVALDLASCLADRERLVPGPACEVHAEVALMEGAEVLDRAELAPIRVRPGETARAVDPVTLVAPGAVEIVPNAAAAALPVGGTTQLSAVVRDGEGAVIAGRTPAWSSENLLVATVNPATGLVTAVGVGRTAVSAAIGRRRAQLAVAVLARVGSVSVAPSPAAVRVNGTVQLAATPRDPAGTPLAGRTVQWSVSDPSVARVGAATGLVTGIAPGTTIVTATVDGVQATTTVAVSIGGIVVTPASARVVVGSSVALTAVATDADGATLTGIDVRWSSG